MPGPQYSSAVLLVYKVMGPRLPSLLDLWDEEEPERSLRSSASPAALQHAHVPVHGADFGSLAPPRLRSAHYATLSALTATVVSLREEMEKRNKNVGREKTIPK